MFQVRIHGSDGGNAVSAAEILSVAAACEGLQARAFASGDPKHAGAPVVTFCRVDEAPIRPREAAIEPDAIIIQDPALLQQHTGLFEGIRPRGYVLINSTRSLADLGCDDLRLVFPAGHVRAVPATGVAALLGTFAALTRELAFDSVAAAIRRTFSARVAEAAVTAARAAFEAIAGHIERDPVHA